MRRKLWILNGIAILGILLLAGMPSAAGYSEELNSSEDSLVIRGNTLNEPDTPDLIPAWDARSFAGFFYDIKNNRKTEYLNITGQTLTDLNSSRTIGDKNLTYMTGKAMVEFKVHENEGMNIINDSDFYRDTYAVVGWKGEKWVAARGNANKLTRLVYEMDKEDKKTMSAGERWSLGAGYELMVNAIDARTNPPQVWFSITKDGEIIDEGISAQNSVYYKTQTIMGESDVLVFAVYIDMITANATSYMVNFKYAWLTDSASAIELVSGDKYGVFTAKEASKDMILLENDGPVNLSRNTEIKLLGNISFKIADSEQLRFYPFVEYRDPGIYEIRGDVFSWPEDMSKTTKWDGQNFAGFFYDIDNNRKTEYLNITGQTLTDLNFLRAIGDRNLTYMTGKTMVEFRVHEKEGLNVINYSKSYEDKYPAVGWKGEKWIAAGGNASILTKLVYEMDAQDLKTMSTGETWFPGAGYEFTVNAIDARTSPPQVWFSLTKNGTVIDDGISTQKNVYYKTQTIMGEPDALVFTVYVDRIFATATSDMVELRYAWLTDVDSAIKIKAGDKYDAFAVKEATRDRIILENDGTVNLSKNTEVKLLGDMAFRIADSDNLRFYPKIDRIIADMDNPPSSLSIRIKQGESFSNSKNVTLSVSAYNAKEMSFSNDDITWSEWEPYTTRKSWMLADGEGAKTVYFKARNAAGEASRVNDTIILDTTPPSVIITSPKNYSVINESSVEIIGNASDISGIKLGSITHAAGDMSHYEEWPVNNSTSLNFSHEIMLHEGLNYILVSYMDAANNFGSAFINLTLPEGKPAVFINLSGIVIINQSTRNVLSVDYRNFNKKDPYSISITNINDSSIVYNKSGKLKGKDMQTIRINWIPHDTDKYRVEARGNTTTAINKTITIYDIEIVSPIPELPTLALTLAGLIGVIGFAGRRRKED